MTVLGVGLDLVEVDSFAELLRAPGSAFSERVFTPDELTRAARLPDHRRVQHLGARFAAKEAFVKAWSAALAGADVPVPVVGQTEVWGDLEVRSDGFGRPSLVATDRVAELLRRDLGDVVTQVSLSHEAGMAGAVVILTRAEVA